MCPSTDIWHSLLRESFGVGKTSIADEGPSISRLCSLDCSVYSEPCRGRSDPTMVSRTGSAVQHPPTSGGRYPSNDRGSWINVQCLWPQSRGPTIMNRRTVWWEVEHVLTSVSHLLQRRHQHFCNNMQSYEHTMPS